MTRSAPGFSWDNVQVGAFFGGTAGALAWLVVVFAAVIEQWIAVPPPAPGPVLALHGGHVVLYVLAGGVIGAGWPWRRHRAVRLLLHAIAFWALAVSAFSWWAGPLWQWPAAMWWQSALAAALFALAFGWSGKPRQ
jgi:hypothetical protein